MAKGCNKALKKGQHGGCSDACVDAIINQALMMLRSVRLMKKELLALYTEDKD